MSWGEEILNQIEEVSIDLYNKYVLLKREAELNDKQKEKLLDMKNASPQIEVMHDLKEEFTEIFDKSKNLGEGTLKLVTWLLKANSFFPKIVRTVIKSPNKKSIKLLGRG